MIQLFELFCDVTIETRLCGERFELQALFIRLYSRQISRTGSFTTSDFVLTQCLLLQERDSKDLRKTQTLDVTKPLDAWNFTRDVERPDVRIHQNELTHQLSALYRQVILGQVL